MNVARVNIVSKDTFNNIFIEKIPTIILLNVLRTLLPKSNNIILK